MSHERWHTWEKVQVQIAIAIGLPVMYALSWSVLRTWDPDQAVVFLPKLELGRLAVFALVLWALAGLCALLTLSARAEGSLLAALVGSGGVSLHSESLAGMLRTYETNLPALLVPLAGELALMAPIIVVAWLIVRAVRRGAARVRPEWVRPENLSPAHPPGGQGGKAKPASARLPLPERVLTNAASFGLTLLIGLLLVTVLMYSADRGQILFALAAAFFVGSAVATYFFPAGTSAACWAAPIVLGVIFYLKACLAPSGFQAWTQLGPWAYALPVDWLSAGCGGAVGGYWLACRLHDMAHMPKPANAVLEE